LLCGKEGVGKLALALAFVRYLNCTNRSETDACGVCPSCVKMNKFIHPDVHFVFPIIKIEKSKKIVCDDFLPEWRNFLSENTYFSYNQWLETLGDTNKQASIYTKESDEIARKLGFKSYEAEYKTMIIWFPEKMHQDCANKLLKLLEEPPEKTLFLLVSEQPDEIILTIQSRAQRINVRSIPQEEMIPALQQRFALSEGDARAIAHISEGSFTRAAEIVSLNNDTVFFSEQFAELMRSAYRVGFITKPVEKSIGLKGLKTWSEQMAGEGRERQKAFLSYSQHMIRENFILNLKQPQLNYMTAGESSFASKFHRFINEKNISGLMNEFGLAEAHIGQNINAKMVFFDLALKSIMLLRNC
jgi:DNA polymerase-3 subunit delta'